MIKRYKHLEVPLGSLERRNLISEHDGKRVIVRDLGHAYFIEGYLHSANSREDYFITERKFGGERMRLKYTNLEGLMVEIPSLRRGSEVVYTEGVLNITV